jgi:hypothetical protein
MCSVSCTKDTDCGVSPWGTTNLCVTTKKGNKWCFAGCDTEAHCDENLGIDFACSATTSVSAQPGKVCAAAVSNLPEELHLP